MEGVLRLQKNPPFSLSEPIYKFSTDFAYIRHRISPFLSLPFPSLPSTPKPFDRERLGTKQLFLGKACGGGRPTSTTSGLPDTLSVCNGALGE